MTDVIIKYKFFYNKIMIFDAIIEYYEKEKDALLGYCRSIIHLCVLYKHGCINGRQWNEGLVLINALYLPHREYPRNIRSNPDGKHIELLKCHLAIGC